MTAPTTLDLTGTWDLDPAHTRLGFAARHAMVATVRGNFGVFSGVIRIDHADPTRSTAEVHVDAASLTTGNDQRDGHLKSPDFLDAEKDPELVFRSSRAEVVDEDTYKLYGELTVRDQTHPVTLELDFQGSSPDPFGNQRAGFEGRTTINRKDWGVNWNAALETGGFLVSDKAILEIDVSAIKLTPTP